MPRNHYEDGNGVLPLRWRTTLVDGTGYPNYRGVIVVEVWTTDLTFWQAHKPQVEVKAAFQVWAWRPTGWHVVGPHGDLTPIAKLPVVRRWAEFNIVRHWSETVALDGWKS